MEWALLGSSLLVILGGAELFTNGVEWIGEGFGLSEGAVGSVLAAVGTALPETILPLVAIVTGHVSGEEIGVGAILGAPFMLTTLAMLVVGLAVVIVARGGRRSTDLGGDPGVLRQDLGYFLVMYTLAMLAGLIHVRSLHWALAQFRKEFVKDPSRLLSWVGAGLRSTRTNVPLDQIINLAFTCTMINPKHVENIVAPGTTGTVGGLSVVNLTSEAQAIFNDMKDDGLVARKRIPPSPNASLLAG